MKTLYDLLIGWWYDVPLTEHEQRMKAWLPKKTVVEQQ